MSAPTARQLALAEKIQATIRGPSWSNDIPLMLEQRDRIAAILARDEQESELREAHQAALLLAMVSYNESLLPDEAEVQHFFELGYVRSVRDCTDEYQCVLTALGEQFIRDTLTPKGPTP